MAVNIHGSGNVFVAQTLLGYLDVDALEKHDGGTKMSQVMKVRFHPNLNY